MNDEEIRKITEALAGALRQLGSEKDETSCCEGPGAVKVVAARGGQPSCICLCIDTKSTTAEKTEK